MNPVEYLSGNHELRTMFRFFRDRPGCSGITWLVAEGAEVKPGDPLGHFTFATGEIVPIVAAATGTLVRTYNPNLADLPHRPSVVIALFEPTSAAVSAVGP
jgi:hypothetical protein